MIQLFPHQQKALDLTATHNRCAYYLDMGLGKTFVGSEKALALNSRVNLLVCQCSKVQDWLDHMVENYAMNHCWIIYDLTNKKDFSAFMAAVKDGSPDPICGVINYELTFRRKILKSFPDPERNRQTVKLYSWIKPIECDSSIWNAHGRQV